MTNKIVDLRSDTVTQPTLAMRAAMLAAPLGDDVFADDPSVNTLQSRLAEQSTGLYDPKTFTPETWTQFLGAQPPLMQNLMNPYLEQSKAMFERMQEQLQKGALFPGVPGFPPATGSK